MNHQMHRSTLGNMFQGEALFYGRVTSNTIFSFEPANKNKIGYNEKVDIYTFIFHNDKMMNKMWLEMENVLNQIY